MVRISASTFALSRPSLKFGTHSISRLIFPSLYLVSSSFAFVGAQHRCALARFPSGRSSDRFFFFDFSAKLCALCVSALSFLASSFSLFSLTLWCLYSWRSLLSFPAFNPATKQSPRASWSSNKYSLQNSREFPDSPPLRTLPNPPVCHSQSNQSSSPAPANKPH